MTHKSENVSSSEMDFKKEDVAISNAFIEHLYLFSLKNEHLK